MQSSCGCFPVSISISKAKEEAADGCRNMLEPTFPMQLWSHCKSPGVVAAVAAVTWEGQPTAAGSYSSWRKMQQNKDYKHHPYNNTPRESLSVFLSPSIYAQGS